MACLVLKQTNCHIETKVSLSHYIQKKHNNYSTFLPLTLHVTLPSFN